MKKILLFIVLIWVISSCSFWKENQESPVFNSWNIEKVSSWVTDQKENWKENSNSWKIEENGEKKDDFKDIALEAFWNEPAWSIKIIWNNLKYSSPLLFSDENKEGTENYKLDFVKKEGENIIFEWKKVKATFTKKACKTDWLWNTIDYSVKFLLEWDMLYKWCWEEILDDFFVKWKKWAYNEIAKKVGWELENNEWTSVPDSEYEIFAVHWPYFYALIGVPSWWWYIWVYKKVGYKYETVCEWQDITLEHCENVAKNHDGLLDYPGFPFEGCRELLENKKADSKENNSCMEAKINLIKNSPDLKDYIKLLDDTKAKKAWSLYDYKIKLESSEWEFENFVITEIHREEDWTQRETNTRHFKIKKNEAKVQEYDVVLDEHKDLNVPEKSVEDYKKVCK